MAKSPEVQWIPSGSVLAVAIGAALVAAILVNVYLGYARRQYEDGGQEFYRLVNKVNAKDKIVLANIEAIKVPRLLVDALLAAKVVPATPEGRNIILDKPAPRDMAAHEFFFIPEFERYAHGIIASPSPGHVLVSLDISADSQPAGQQLQPGSYVRIMGTFNVSTDPKREDPSLLTVMDFVQVRTIDGSPEPSTDKGRRPSSIQIEVPADVGKQFHQLQDLLVKQHQKPGFIIDVASVPDRASSEPALHQDVMKLLTAPKPRPAAVGPTGPAPPPLDSPKPDIN